MHNGVPFDLAFSLDDNTATGFCVIFSEFNGASFDWDVMKFRDPT